MLYRVMIRAGRNWSPIGIDCYSRREALQQAAALVPHGADFYVLPVEA